MTATEKACQILGVDKIAFLGLPDNRLDSVPLLEVVQALEATVAVAQPEIVYTHHFGDLNVDHRVAFQAVMTACRPLPVSSVKKILGFEVLSSTEWSGAGPASFMPNYFVDVSATLDIKIRALQAYATEMREAPHSRSIEHVCALARHRGYSMGIDAAEAFMLIRCIAE